MTEPNLEKLIDNYIAGEMSAVKFDTKPTYKMYDELLISLRHSVNGDFCGHSRFVLWHENITTFVS